VHVNIFIFKVENRNNYAKNIIRHYKNFSRLGGQAPGILQPLVERSVEHSLGKISLKDQQIFI
jgi:hypothetical protein